MNCNHPTGGGNRQGDHAMTQITDTPAFSLLADEAGFDPIEDRLRANVSVAPPLHCASHRSASPGLPSRSPLALFTGSVRFLIYPTPHGCSMCPGITEAVVTTQMRCRIGSITCRTRRDGV